MIVLKAFPNSTLKYLHYLSCLPDSDTRQRIINQFLKAEKAYKKRPQIGSQYSNSYILLNSSA